jgi:hypothetical protein
MMSAYFWRGLLGALGLGGTTFANALSAPSRVSSAPIARAVSMKRFSCSESSGFGFGLRGICGVYARGR